MTLRSSHGRTLLLSLGAAVLAGAVAAAPAARGGHAAYTALNPNRLPALAGEGLVVGIPTGVLLVRLDGHVYGLLRGFALAGQSGVGSRNSLLDGMALQESGRQLTHRPPAVSLTRSGRCRVGAVGWAPDSA